ncbi:uroporphyrinogen-III C-methyltransferase [Duganella sp. FT109W]|uniref:uroporphyrinogen-III C-methyltransferase n=1 Tax=Duganella margarita TaxID=2692170 RepID=A0A7X4H6G4_9BURK|nr:uroporphyrinogen-III C-methyltransferase [Duganella margarita]MYM75676.1 uroporphyrinogen-III C-methyltransferase [Duganella margarita]MYN42785.1 uroporphyrinogen-III C-methyltransferase [Duganella margarita]
MPTPGKVYLIGAGPGAQDLITVRGARLLAQADIVLHDALVTSEMLELCPQAEKIAVGKRSGQRSMAQQVINQQLVDAARRAGLVVRLKGGDPMLFGRADEELRALEEAGIEADIVPGITTALAAAAATRQPLTKRGVARSVAFFTSSTAPEHADHDAIPETDTLVQYMGGREAIATAERLLAHGHAPDKPVVVIENVSRADQQIHRIDIAQLTQGLGTPHGPVLVMIGEAMRPRPNQSLNAESSALIAAQLRA